MQMFPAANADFKLQKETEKSLREFQSRFSQSNPHFQP